MSGDNEVGRRSATSSLAGGVSAGDPCADAQGPGDAGIVDPQLRHAGPNGFDVNRIATDEAFDPGLNLRLGPQITEIRKTLDEPLCQADFNHTTTVAAWLRQRSAALPAPIKDDTSFERLPSLGRRLF